MQRRKMALIAGGALALAALLAWAFAQRPVEVELATASVGRFEREVAEDGRTRLRQRYVVAAPLAGRLARITLTEGDRIEAGAVIATLTPTLPAMIDERSLRELGSRVEAADAGVALAGARIERAKVGLAQARSDLQRSEQLARQGFVAPTKLDADQLAVQAAQREVDAAVQSRHVAQHDLEQARAALGAVRDSAGGKAQGRAFDLRAPVTGRVLRVVQTSETPVALGTPLIELGDLAALEVVAELLTADALSTPPGSLVRIERWGGPALLEGRVRRVEPAGFTKVSALGVEEQRVRVLIDITSPPAQWQLLGDGFRVGVRIVTLAQDKALRVPVSAVFPLPPDGGDSAAERHAVFVFDGARARLTPVQVGARNGSQAWVRGGLDANARVLVYPPAAVSDGTRVRERKV